MFLPFYLKYIYIYISFYFDLLPAPFKRSFVCNNEVQKRGKKKKKKKNNIFSKAVQMLQVNYKLHGNCYNTAGA